MSHVTSQLGEESGIQYQGVQDNSNNQRIGNLSNMLMLVENVPRGRLDGSMTVTRANKNAVLGREAGSLFLQAVDDALNTGVNSVQVLRVANDIG